MTDDEIGKVLRRLPRTTASPRFRSDVIRAVRGERRPKIMWRLVAATAMMLTLVVGSYATSVHRQRQQRIEALRAERQQIESELRRVKAIANEVEPVGVVLVNGDTRVIVDLNQQAKLTYY